MMTGAASETLLERANLKNQGLMLHLYISPREMMAVRKLAALELRTKSSMGRVLLIEALQARAIAAEQSRQDGAKAKG